jgi:hypothetical protein
MAITATNSKLLFPHRKLITNYCSPAKTLYFMDSKKLVSILNLLWQNPSKIALRLAPDKSELEARFNPQLLV